MMKSSWSIGNFRGIDIRIDSSWIVIFIFFSWSLASGYFPKEYPHWSRGLGWGVGVLTSLLVFVSVLLHEMAHSIVALSQGEKVHNITLFLFGGVARIGGEPNQPAKEFRMALAGPLASLGLAGIFLALSVLLHKVSEPFAASALYLAVINAGLAIFNLLPGFPMDGGRLFRAILWKTTGDIKKATRIASVTGQGIAFFLIFVGAVNILRGEYGGLWLVLIGWFLHSASVRGYAQVAIKGALMGMKAGDLMTRDFETVDPGLPVQNLVDEYILKKRERVFLVSSAFGELKGIVCLEDVKETPRPNWATTTVGEIMTPRERLNAVREDADGNEILAKLTALDVHQVPVMEGDKVLGVICRTDLLRVLQLRKELGI